MNKFRYFKRVIGSQVQDLHIWENRDNRIIGQQFPENDDFFNKKDLIELEGVDEFLDLGIETGIFNEKPVPRSSI